MYTGKIAFKKGLDTCTSSPPNGFINRFSVLTWFEKGPDQADPWPLVRLAIPKISQLIKAESVIAEFYEDQKVGFLWLKRERRVTKSILWTELMEDDDHALHNEEFPHRLKFMKNGETLLIEESELWNKIGGPAPYHDSLTLSFFSADPMDQAMYTIFCEAAKQIGVEVENI